MFKRKKKVEKMIGGRTEDRKADRGWGRRIRRVTEGEGHCCRHKERS